MPNKTQLNTNGADESPNLESEEYMSENQVAHFKDKLLSHKKSLEGQINNNLSELKSNNEKVADPADAASQNEELILTLNKQEEAKKEIKEIDRSLRLIAEDDYGYCHSCGIEIGLKRLDARPTSIRCIDCASIEEEKNKLHSRVA